MAFDLSKVINQATEVASQQSGGGEGNNKPRIVYPGPGTLKVKLLYNPKASIVSRSIKRHKIVNTNYTCLSMYGMDCPICKTVESIKNATGADMWKLDPKFRGLSYAQYVGSDNYAWDNDNPEPQKGELILLMYPWTIYQDINRIIATAGVHASELIASNKGKVISIIRWREKSQEKYKAEVDAFSEYTSFPSDNGDDDFDKFLNELPDLNEALCPSTMDEETHKLAMDASETLSREYLRGTGYSTPAPTNQNISGTSNVVTGTDGNQYVLVNGQYVAVQPQAPVTQSVPPVVTNPAPTQQVAPTPQVVPQVSQQVVTPQPQVTASTPAPQESATPNNFMNPPTTVDGVQMPECFGQHQDNNPKCMACLYEIQCQLQKN